MTVGVLRKTLYSSLEIGCEALRYVLKESEDL